MTASAARARVLALLLAAVMGGLASCGGDDTNAGDPGRATAESTAAPASPTSNTTSPAGPTPTPTLAACGSDLLGPDRPSVELQVPDAVARAAVLGTGPFPCASRVWVDGGGIAVFLFGSDGACHFAQSTPVKPGTAVARAPDGTMLRIDQGMANCTLGRPITLCGPGSILPTSDYAQVSLTCDPDPVFEVSVFAGSVTVVTPGRDKLALVARQVFRCDPLQCLALQPEDNPVFTEAARGNFARHIQRLELSPNVFGPASQAPPLPG